MVDKTTAAAGIDHALRRAPHRILRNHRLDFAGGSDRSNGIVQHKHTATGNFAAASIHRHEDRRVADQQGTHVTP